MTGQELKAIREKHNLSIKAFAEILGYKANYIGRLEHSGEWKETLPINKRLETLVLSRFKEKKDRKPTHST